MTKDRHSEFDIDFRSHDEAFKRQVEDLVRETAEKAIAFLEENRADETMYEVTYERSELIPSLALSAEEMVLFDTELQRKLPRAFYRCEFTPTSITIHKKEVPDSVN